MFACNAWYVAAWANEVTKSPLGRRLLNEPIVLYRGESGKVTALEDRCCHRGMPLSGRGSEVTADRIRCGYHGLLFDPSGRCVEIPGQKTIPASAVVRSYPVEERDELVWIWMGDADKADRGKVVRYPYHAAWPHKVKTERLACNYALISDNLLDQSHAAYVHKSTLASDPQAYVDVEMKIEPLPTGVRFVRWMRNCQPPPLYAAAVTFKGRVDRWQEFEYVAPSCILQFTGAVDVGQSAHENGNRDGGFGLRMFYGITPETERTSWFLWSAANGYRQNEPEATEQLFRAMENAFEEDNVVLEQQQTRLSEFPERPQINTNHDGARVSARLAVERLIAAEQRGTEGAR